MGLKPFFFSIKGEAISFTKGEISMLITDRLLTVAVALWGTVWLVFMIIYEEVLAAFEDGIKEQVKEKVDKWKRKIKNLFSAV